MGRGAGIAPGPFLISNLPNRDQPCGRHWALWAVYFEVLSYAGTLTLTAIIDPDHFPDPATLTDALHAELDQIIGHPAVPR